MVLPTGGRKPGIPGQSRNELTDRILALGSTLEDLTTVSNRADTRVFDVRRYGPGLSPNGVDDWTNAINAAIDAATEAGGGTVYFPQGIYLVRPVLNTTYLTLASNITYLGDGYHSEIRVGESNGDYYAVFRSPSSDTRVENVTFAGLRINQNVPAQTAPTDPFGLSGQASQHAIAGWNVGNITVRDCWFDECCGVNTVYLNGGGFDTTDLFVTNCVFAWRVLPNATPQGSSNRYYDNSAVYLAGDRARVTGNHFIARTSPGAMGACEFHGPRMTYANNIIDGYETMINLGSSSGRDASDWIVTGNTGRNTNVAIRAFLSHNNTTNDRIRIVNNNVHVNTALHQGITGVGILVTGTASGDGTLEMLDISHNTVQFVQDTRTTAWTGATLSVSSYFMGIGVTLGNTIRGGTISDNVVVDAPVYALSLGGPGSDFRNLTVQRNILDTPGWMDTWTTNRLWIRMQGDFTDCEITDNTLIDTRDASTNQRVWLNAQNIGTCRNTWVDRNYRKDTGVGGWSTASTWLPSGLWGNIYRSFSRATIDPTEIAAGAEYTTTITHGGATTADMVTATPNGALENGLAYFARVSAADTITLHIRNYTSSAINPASRIWRFQLHRTQQDQG